MFDPKSVVCWIFNETIGSVLPITLVEHDEPADILDWIVLFLIVFVLVGVVALVASRLAS